MSTRILLIGATGPTGRQILARSRDTDLQVRALARRPEALAGDDAEGIDVVRGDVLDPATLTAALAGVDQVVSSLGSKLSPFAAVHLLSAGTTNLVAAMRDAGVGRLVCITGVGAGDSRGHGGFAYDRLIRPTLLRNVYADKDRQEDVVRASDLDWLLLRPAVLTNGARTGKHHAVTRFAPGEKLRPLSRADVADFVVGEVLSQRYHRATVNLGGGR